MPADDRNRLSSPPANQGHFSSSASAWARVFFAPRGILTLFALIYLATLTSDYFWDGITFALQIEKVTKGERGLSFLFHQNHLLYNALGYLLYISVRSLGLSFRALTILELANVVIGAIGVGLFFQLVERVTRSRYWATVCSMALAVSATWWKLSTDADAYIPAVVLILLCLRNLTGENPRWYIAAFALAGAMLMHEIASLFSLGAIATVFSSRLDNKKGFAAKMSIAAWLSVISVYYLCAYLLHGIGRPLDVIRWATSNPSLISPSVNPIPGLLQTPRANLDLVVGHSFNIFLKTGGAIEWVAALASVAAGLTFIYKVTRNRCELLRQTIYKTKAGMRCCRMAYVTLAMWVAPYIIFLCFFEPQDPYLRLFYAPALFLAVGLFMSDQTTVGSLKVDSLRKQPTRYVGTSAAAYAVAMLALGNLAFFIAPHLHVRSNQVVAAAREARKVWSAPTVIYFESHNEADTTFEYFNDQTLWRKATRLSEESLERDIESAHSKGESVWITREVVASLDPEWLKWHTRGDEIRVDLAYAPAFYLHLEPLQLSNNPE